MVMTSVVSGRHAVPVSEPVEPEVSERATRRVFSPQYKLRILEEYERHDRNGRGALLRREGLYTSSISEWRRQREEGALQALTASPGRPSTDPREHELARLRRENARLQSDLSKARRRSPGKTLRVAGAARHGQRGADWWRADSVTDETITELAQ